MEASMTGAPFGEKSYSYETYSLPSWMIFIITAITSLSFLLFIVPPANQPPNTWYTMMLGIVAFSTWFGLHRVEWRQRVSK